MGTLANSEDPDEMQYNAAFQQGLQCLIRQKNSYLETIPCDPSNYTMNHPKFIVPTQREESNSA